MNNTHFAFLGSKLVAEGDLLSVILKLSNRKTEDVLLFESESGKQIDVDMRGDDEALKKRFGEIEKDETLDVAAPRGRGRPKLGVVGREITLLPRHWLWLDKQRGGASGTIRRLVDEARKGSVKDDRVREAQDRCNRFISVMAGNLPGFEEATRALFSTNQQSFLSEVKGWPSDVKRLAIRFSEPVFDG